MPGELTQAKVVRSHGRFVSVSGTFYRAVVDGSLADPLAGSAAAGRYSRANQRTLYMSATEEGVTAAMQAHPLPAGLARTTWSLAVRADKIADLRDEAIFAAIGMRREDALGPWQEALSQGIEPLSWSVRDALVALGANGLIDPSRRANGLWHLVLFQWNVDGGAKVRLGSGEA